MHRLLLSLALTLPLTAMCADRITGKPFATRSEVYAPHAIAATSHDQARPEHHDNDDEEQHRSRAGQEDRRRPATARATAAMRVPPFHRDTTTTGAHRAITSGTQVGIDTIPPAPNGRRGSDEIGNPSDNHSLHASATWRRYTVVMTATTMPMAAIRLRRPIG